MRITLSIPLSVSEVAGALGSKGWGLRDEKIFFISTDTREAKAGDLFFALSGKLESGENYVTEELCKRLFVVTTKSFANSITVSDTKEALLKLCAFYLGKLKKLKYKVAITGSVGKTTTKEFTRVLTSGSYLTHGSEGNFNNEIGVPLTVFSAPKDTELLITEVGMNHAGEISRISKALSPDIALITNIGTAHIGNLGSRENIAKAKLEILDGMAGGVLIAPKNEPLLLPFADKTFSISDASANLFVTKNEIYEDGRFSAKHEFSLRGEHFLFCLSSALAVSRELNIDFSTLVDRIYRISDDNTRQKITSVGSFYILEDYYNASIESIEADFRLLASYTDYGKRSALLGDILELGDMTEEIHRRVGKLAKDYKLDKLYLFGGFSKHYREGAISSGFDETRIFINEDNDNIDLTKEQIQTNSSPNEIILFKASHAMQLWRIADALKKQNERS